MRVTNQMIANQVFHNLGRSLDRFMTLQAQMSSGRKIIRPSDDPIGTQKDLRYRQILSEIGQYKKNISSSVNLMSTYDTTLGNISNKLSSAFEAAIGFADDTSESVSAVHSEVESLYQEILTSINYKLEGRYIYSGFKTDTEPILASSNGVEYLGDNGDFQVQIQSGTKVSVNMIGSEVLLDQLKILGEDHDIEVGVNASTPLAELNMSGGIDQAPGIFVITDNNLGISVNVDISGMTTVGDLFDPATGVTAQLAAGGINNLTLEYGDEGHNLKLAATSNGLISDNTPLSNLNNGAGLNFFESKISIHDASYGINLEVDLSGAATIGDVRAALDAALAPHGVSTAINAAGTGIDIIDPNGPPPLGLIVEDIGSGTIASDLGIDGEVNDRLFGDDLNPAMDWVVEESAPGETTAADLGLNGTFEFARVGENLNPLLTLNTEISVLKYGKNLDLGEIKISQGSRTAYVDLSNPAYTTVSDLIDALNNLGLDIEASINDAQTGIQVVPTIDSQSLKIEEVGDGRAAHQLGIFGSPDVMGSMLILLDAMNSEDRDTAREMIDNIDLGLTSILNRRAEVGSIVNRLETTDSQLSDLDYSFTKLLSETEDADLTKLVSDLAMQENSYRAALIASSKIIQPSLMDFLR